MNIDIDQGHVRSILESAGSRMISVRFYKKDGTERKLTGQLKVRKHLKGGTNTLANKENLVTIYDVNMGGYRSFDIGRLIEIKCNGTTYNVTDSLVEKDAEHLGYVLHDENKDGFLNTTRGHLYKITGVRDSLGDPSGKSCCYEIIDDSGEFELVMTGNQFVYTHIPADSQGLVSFDNDKAFDAIAGSVQWVRFSSNGFLPLFESGEIPLLYNKDESDDENISTDEEKIRELVASLEDSAQKFVEEVRKSVYEILDETSIKGE